MFARRLTQCLCLLLLIFAVSGCSGSGSSGVAATVNGEEIPEEQVTSYIDSFIERQGYTTEQWAQYLAANDTTAAEFREDVVDYYVEYLLYEQKAAELGLSVSDEDVANDIADMKEQMGLDDDSWNSYLSGQGYTEESYESTVAYSLLVSKVQAQELTAPEPTDDQIHDYADQNLLNYDGKLVYGIKFSEDDYDKAEDLLDEIKEADDPVKAFKDNVGASEDETLVKAKGELGWSCLVSYGDDWTEMVGDLEKGKVYDYLYQDNQSNCYYIIYCANEYAPAYYGDIDKALKHMPKALKKNFDAAVTESVYNDAVDSYVQSMKDAADIKINDIPADADYNVEPQSTSE